MILSSDKIYILNQSGDTIVLRASPKFEIIGVNSIGNGLTNATLAVSDGESFIRSQERSSRAGSAWFSWRRAVSELGLDVQGRKRIIRFDSTRTIQEWQNAF